MNNFTRFLKSALMATTLLWGGNVWGAWTWTGEAHTNGDMTADFYVYNVVQNQWVGVDGSTPKTYTDLTNAIMFNKISSYRYGLWSTGYTLEFDNAKRLKCDDGNAQVATANEGAKTNMFWTAENTSYLNTYRIESQDGARYMEAVGDGQTLSFPKKDNKHAGNYNMWYFISADQVTTYNNRFFYFQADPQVGVGEGSVEAQGEVAYELVNYADRLNTHTQTLTFSATPNVEGGYQFQGWYETEDCSGDCVSTANPYTPSVSNDAAGEAAKKTMTLYAKFVAELTPVIEINPGADAMLVGDEVALTDMFTTDHTPSLVYTLEDNDGVLSLTEGVVNALKVGSATIVATQEAVPGIKYAQAKFTITVSKHTPIIAWAENVYENQEVTIYTLVDGDIELFSAVSSEPMVASISGEHGTMLKAYNHGGSTIITITATETDYWAGEVFTKEITPVKAPLHVAAELNSAEQYEAHKAWTGSTVAWDEAKNGIRFANGGAIDYNQHEYDLYFEGIPDSLSFTTSTSSGLASATFWVEESVDGLNWSNKIWESTQRDNTAKIALQPTTRYVKLHHNGNYYGYMQDIRISEKVVFEADSEMLSFFATEVSVVTEAKPLVLTHANIGYVTGVDVSEGFEVSLDGENFVESLSISSLENIVTGGDIMGTVTLYVRYLAETAEHVDGELVIYTNKDDAELFVALTGIVGKDPTALDNASLREAKKVLRNGQVFIVRDGKLYDLRGMVIE